MDLFGRGAWVVGCGSLVEGVGFVGSIGIQFAAKYEEEIIVTTSQK